MMCVFTGVVQLTRKPNAQVPLAPFTGGGPYPHPYEHELQNLVYEPWMLEPNDESDFSTLDAVPFYYVDTLAGLEDLLSRLASPDVRELAIDLEAHSIRSYSGLCCLMQLSTRKVDAVVDTLALWPHMHKFLEVFTDPRVVKVWQGMSVRVHPCVGVTRFSQVLHGSKSDVVWLQRDFGLYLVNVFDTGEAARVLKYPSFGLAHLLDVFCGVQAQKQYQVCLVAPAAGCAVHLTLLVFAVGRLARAAPPSGNAALRPRGHALLAWDLRPHEERAVGHVKPRLGGPAD